MAEKELNKQNQHISPPLEPVPPMREVGGITIYGIPNCDTVQKVITWFKNNDITFEFYDYKKNGITAKQLKTWCKQKGWEVLLNKKSSTWRGLGADKQATVSSEKTAIEVMVQNPSIIKRPVIELNGKVLAVGFNENEYLKVFIK